eukprot:CAMPEP_0197865336 /NCGR_PEP_ID=MMETSP1438-20131217/43608_1 /TAXON_ID=1461541 /ORGANISM="Pterosperma sp., Strain CCMP1384" /LENGTH=30 /DNA_ID= /DNA_START= /DNA_END= /DNA_ORIENTATION=
MDMDMDMNMNMNMDMSVPPHVCRHAAYVTK